MRRAEGGMTLIEVLVAMSLMAILSVLGYKAFSSLLIARTQLTAMSGQWVELARVFRRVEADVARSGRLPLVPPQPDDAALQLSTQEDGQWLRLAGYSSHSPLGETWRHYRTRRAGLDWAIAPSGIEQVPERYPLLTAGQSVRFAVLASDGDEYEQWPLPELPADAARALLMTVTLGGGQQVRRVWSLP